MKKIFAILICAIMVFGCTTAAFAVEVSTEERVEQFTDVSETDWFYDAVVYAVDQGLFSGTGTTTFSPMVPMTRGMFVTVLGRMNGVNAEEIEDNGQFDDVVFDSYYGPYVVWANELGVVHGTSQNSFSPNDNITREQIAVMLHRYFEATDREMPQSEEAVAEFSDIDNVSDYAKEAVDAMRKSCFVVGSNGRYLPQDPLSRSQAAMILARVDYYLKTGEYFLISARGEGTLAEEQNGKEIESLAFAKSEYVLAVGEEMTLFVNVFPETAEDKTVTLSSSDREVVDVGADMIACGLKPGSVTITATSANGKTATCTITVKAGSVSATGIKVSPEELSLAVGESTNIVATVLPENATDNIYSMIPEDAEIVEIVNGVVSAKKEGTTNIVIRTYGGVETKLSVTVKKATGESKPQQSEAGFKVNFTEFVFETSSYLDDEYTINNPAAILKITDKDYVEAGVIPALMPYTFKSSDTSVVSVSETGRVYGIPTLSNGEADRHAIITVTNIETNGYIEIPVTVTNKQWAYTIDEDYIAAFAAEALRLTNLRRAENGVGSVSYNYGAQSAMDVRTELLTQNFSHTYDPSDVPGVEKLSGAENIASYKINIFGNQTSESPEDAAATMVQLWMESAGHKTTMLGSPWSQMVISLSYGDNILYSAECFYR